MNVIGTAGHIDHGKSTLVHRLTGMDPDRLSEEKRRGMTIDLGFAWLTLPSGREASIVDVPGHERFVKNMLAGAAGVDVALLVVAADEGVMPQTREHLDILDLLDVRQGVVALTKADLVDSDWLDLIRDDVRTVLRGTSLQGSPMLAVSAVTGSGLPDLLQALDQKIAAGPGRRDRGRPFVPVDRVFSVTGFGTVVTGTLHDGSLWEGQDVVIEPGARQTRIRTLQSHRAHVAEAGPGSRVALNLQGVSTQEVARGDVVEPPGSVVVTSRLDARVRVLPTSPIALRHGMSVSLHLGAAEVDATTIVLSGAEIEAGSAGWVQFRLRAPLAAARDQRLVVRLPSPVRTVAGGTVVDLTPRHRRADGRALRRLDDLLSTEPATVVRAALDFERPATLDEAAFRCGLSGEATHAAVQQLLNAGEVRRLGTRYLLTDRWNRVAERARTALVTFHAEFPLRPGMSREELRSRAGWRYPDWPEVARALTEAGTIREVGPLVSLPDHAGGTAGRRADAEAVLQCLVKDRYSPPSGARLLAESGADEALLAAMVVEGEIVRVESGLYFDRATYKTMVERVVESIRRDGPIAVATVRDMFGTSRKYALALMEHLDDERITRRQGDLRGLGSRAQSHA